MNQNQNSNIFCRFDIVGSVVLFPLIWTTIDDLYFMDVDGTVNPDWAPHHRFFVASQVLCYIFAAFRIVLGIIAIGSRMVNSENQRDRDSASQSFVSRVLCPCKRLMELPITVSPTTDRRIRTTLRYLLNGSILIVVVVFFICLRSLRLQFLPGSSPDQDSVFCDPMDPTECWLPFPNHHFLTHDNSTDTGYRVNIPSEVMPPLKNLREHKIEYLNRMDGFSTMSLILWYLNGLQEAQEGGGSQLYGPNDIAKTVSNSSITLLIDVETGMLVPHQAELSDIEKSDPMVVMIPSRPLFHNRHYAVAILNARDVSGMLLPRTTGMINLLNGASSFDSERRDRFMGVVLPTLAQAAPWVDTTDESLQLVFDFHTISENSQLGTVRTVRDGVLNKVSTDWDWREHVRTVKTDDFDCATNRRARTVHAEIDVPWFLESRSRFSHLDRDALATGKPKGTGVTKFMVHIPCSIKHAITNDTAAVGKPLRTLVEYGHGAYGKRVDSMDPHLHDLADDNGYIIFAADWRGASAWDAIVVGSLVASRPSLIQALRDNVIQGYACKYALWHFTQTTLVSMDWLRFESRNAVTSSREEQLVPTLNNQRPHHAFMGFSQGGILGGGYSPLSGATGLIDRAVLIAGGTPMGDIMSRMGANITRLQLLVTFCYGNRHLRTYFSMLQMLYDTVEAGGSLALPVTEPVPPVLLHAAPGDKSVAISTSHALARAFNASLLSNRPRPIFGLPTMPAANGSSLGPAATFSELVYLPETNTHACIRLDPAILEQTVEFLNTGRVIDPCSGRDCYRTADEC